MEEYFIPFAGTTISDPKEWRIVLLRNIRMYAVIVVVGKGPQRQLRLIPQQTHNRRTVLIRSGKAYSGLVFQFLFQVNDNNRVNSVQTMRKHPRDENWPFDKILPNATRIVLTTDSIERAHRCVKVADYLVKICPRSIVDRLFLHIMKIRYLPHA